MIQERSDVLRFFFFALSCRDAATLAEPLGDMASWLGEDPSPPAGVGHAHRAYIARRDEQPDAFDRQLEFATVLLYREREYRSMYSSDWLVRGVRPAASPDSPFEPYDLTPEAADHLAALIDGVQTLDAPPSPDDLFGLKRSALDGLRRTLRPVKAHAFGWLVASRLHADLVERAEAAVAAARAGDLGESQVAGALLAPFGIARRSRHSRSAYAGARSARAAR